MTPASEGFPDLTEAGEHRLPASFFGFDAHSAPLVFVLVGEGREDVLAPHEQQRAHTFGSPKRRQEFVRGRTLLRQRLAALTGQPPCQVVLERASGGGLVPLADNRHLSLTHTSIVAAVAVAGSPVGLDAEQIRPVSPALAQRLCAPGEVLPDTDGALLQVWAAKEAVLKAMGEGVRGGLRHALIAWTGEVEGAWHARARIGERAFVVSTRRYCNIQWAIALQETEPPAHR